VETGEIRIGPKTVKQPDPATGVKEKCPDA
jgi:hypothetical protein